MDQNDTTSKDCALRIDFEKNVNLNPTKVYSHKKHGLLRTLKKDIQELRSKGSLILKDT